MENDIQHREDGKGATGNNERPYLLPASVLVSALVVSGAWIYSGGVTPSPARSDDSAAVLERTADAALEESVLPGEGVDLPAIWGDLGQQLVAAGAIDAPRFRALYEKRGAWSDEYAALLSGQSGRIRITKENAGYLLNLFWALGLASSNPILDSGEMTDPRYGGAKNFASTAGWSIAKGDPMNHYSRHKFFDLTPTQQALVEKVSKGIYRPCCGNSTHFPDCNHGMAMLGLLELMASQGASEGEMWNATLAVSSYWFPDTYMTIATYMKGKGIEWKRANPREILGANYSSSQGFAKISAQVVEPKQQKGGSGCGVDAGGGIAPEGKQGGCGI